MSATKLSSRRPKRAERSGELLTDFGYLTGYQRTSDGVQLVLDRATPVWGGPGNWGAENTSPRTYEYLTAAVVRINDGTPGLCRNPPDLSALCELDTVLQRLDEGDARSDGGVPVRQIPVWLGMDESGHVMLIVVA